MPIYNPKEWTDKGLDPNISSLCLNDDQARVLLEMQEEDIGGFNKAVGAHWDAHRWKDRQKHYEAAQNALTALIDYAGVAEDYNLEDTLSRIVLPEISEKSHSFRYKKMTEEEITQRLQEVGTTPARIKILKTELLKTI